MIIKGLGIFEFVHDVLVDFISERDSRWRYCWIWSWWERHTIIWYRRATLSGDRVSCSGTLGYAGVVSTVWYTGFPGTLRAALLVGAVGLGCSIGAVIGVLVYFSAGGEGSCCFGSMLAINMSTNCSTSVVYLGPYNRNGVAGPVLHRIMMRSRIALVALSGEDRAGIFFLLVRPPMSQSLLIMGWCSSIPKHRLRLHLDSGPIR